MKLKKLFAGVVAVAMMATMAMPSFAALSKTETVAPNSDNEVEITKTYNGTGFGSETVKLAVDNNGKPTAITHSSMTTAEKNAAMNNMVISIPTDQADGITVKDTDGTGTLKVKLPSYTRVGTYIYQIHEVEGTTAGMTYDTAPRWLVVHVINNLNSDGDVVPGLTYKVAMYNADPTNMSTTQLLAAKSDGFTNVYENGKFTVEKKVKGNMADRDKVFNFRVTFAGIEHMNGKIKADGREIDLTEDGTYDFTLKHDQSCEFTNIPFGVTATVNELDESGNVIANTAGAKNDPYTVSYDNNQSVTIGSKTETDTGVKVNAEFATTIINTSTENVDTGVILDNAPYMLMLAVVAAGAMTLVIKKRREEE